MLSGAKEHVGHMLSEVGVWAPEGPGGGPRPGPTPPPKDSPATWARSRRPGRRRSGRAPRKFRVLLRVLYWPSLLQCLYGSGHWCIRAAILPPKYPSTWPQSQYAKHSQYKISSHDFSTTSDAVRSRENVGLFGDIRCTFF